MVKAASGGRYVVGCRPKIDKSKLKPGTRVTLDITTYTIMMILPREVDPTVHNMVAEDPGEIKYGDVGGLTSASCAGPCVAGYACPTGSVTATAQLCQPGTYRWEAPVCVPCLCLSGSRIAAVLKAKPWIE